MADPTTNQQQTQQQQSKPWTEESARLSDLTKRYGLSYSPAEIQQMGDVFRQGYEDQATSAFRQAQSTYYGQMRGVQNTLQDTLRRNRANAIATGASRGVDAANELSAMMNLTSEAAQGSQQLGTDYGNNMAQARVQAEQLASQLKQSEQQNAANVLGQEISADYAAAAQRYAADVDAATQRYNADRQAEAQMAVQQLQNDLETGVYAATKAKEAYLNGDFDYAKQLLASSLKGNPAYVDENGILTDAGRNYINAQMKAVAGDDPDFDKNYAQHQGASGYTGNVVNGKTYNEASGPVRTNSETGELEWVGSDGVVVGITIPNHTNYQDANWGDLQNGDSEDFVLELGDDLLEQLGGDDSEYYIQCAKGSITASSNSDTYDVLQAYTNNAPVQGQVVLHDNHLYVYAGTGVWRAVTGGGTGSNFRWGRTGFYSTDLDDLIKTITGGKRSSN